MEMMKRSMNSVLLESMENHILSRGGKLKTNEDTELFFKEMEDVAVTKVPNEIQMDNLRAITQNPGERVHAFLNRIRAAASYVKTLDNGNGTHHPLLKNLIYLL